MRIITGFPWLLFFLWAGFSFLLLLLCCGADYFLGKTGRGALGMDGAEGLFYFFSFVD